MDFTPISRHGLIGDGSTCALVAEDGTIDWWCVPNLDSPSVFGRLLDPGMGGFSIEPVSPATSSQRYEPDTNVLHTEFETESGAITVTDFIPKAEDGPSRVQSIYRRVTCEEGPVTVQTVFEPRFDYARADTVLEENGEAIIADGETERLQFASESPLRVDDDRAIGHETLEAGDVRWSVAQHDGETAPDPSEGEAVLETTVDYWTDWVGRENGMLADVIEDRWVDAVVRSGLVLKLLMQEETGAICAAPTTSLPETLGGVRNWDYRYNWIRDSKLTVQALYALGKRDEAHAYFEWFLDLCESGPEELQPIYGLRGELDLEEELLEEHTGYRYSKPVRIGNAAADQHQGDIYGSIVQGIYETLHYDEDLDEEGWRLVEAVVDYTCEIWDEPGEGIWEFRDEPRHHVHSKLMCWIALERGIEIAELDDREAPLERWREVREEIREAILERGYSEEAGAFVQHFDTDEHLDASTLLIPISGFLPADDERVQNTIDAILADLTSEEGFVYRYKRDDGLPGEEGAFVLCSFWLVDALALSGRIEEAEEIFETLLDHANPLGLFAEEIEPGTGTFLGNFPQAFSHIGLINSAIYLSVAKEEEIEAEGGEFSTYFG
ncbi:glycoside hydrolase family 15 protein [Halalkalicoccus tibetensis]|uniref:Glycoside hydrolase family 15 protein n=1 Tax=Halalkalicoccus tibetensis TaxID=175632 RepID=A0ABD5UZ42_9EURY